MNRQQMLDRLNQILSSPTADEQKRRGAEPGYECKECGTSERPKPCRTKGCVCCPKCGGRP